ncbi:hypothetical protein TNCV_783371 [Trichonephila clavipes]|nr:hypothetical protein TNCV_783371 [Trichonephila clavipes]
MPPDRQRPDRGPRNSSWQRIKLVVSRSFQHHAGGTDPPFNIYRIGHLSAPAPAGVFHTFLNSFQIGTLSIYNGSLLMGVCPGTKYRMTLRRSDSVDPEDHMVLSRPRSTPELRN